MSPPGNCCRKSPSRQGIFCHPPFGLQLSARLQKCPACSRDFLVTPRGPFQSLGKKNIKSFLDIFVKLLAIVGVGVGWAENTACYVLLLDPGKEKRTLYIAACSNRWEYVLSSVVIVSFTYWSTFLRLIHVYNINLDLYMYEENWM